jgi:hypothetical protein
MALNPLSYTPIIDGVRRANIRRFPLALWFRIDEDGSVVIACLHAKRDLELNAFVIFRTKKP